MYVYCIYSVMDKIQFRGRINTIQRAHVEALEQKGR